MHKRQSTDFVWLPRATSSFFSLRKLMLVKARVLPTFIVFVSTLSSSFAWSASCGVVDTYIYRSLLRLGSYYRLDPPTKDTLLNRIPELMSPASHQKISAYIPFRSVETPVEYNPLEATANEPPRSTECRDIYQCASTEYHTSKCNLPMEAIVPP